MSTFDSIATAIILKQLNLDEREKNGSKKRLKDKRENKRFNR